MRCQVIDTPGILDHPFENMNIIEMQIIIVLAHLKACILYFVDLSEQCDYTIKAQVCGYYLQMRTIRSLYAQSRLFHSIRPLFVNMLVMLVMNKIDVKRWDDLSPKGRTLVDEIISSEGMISVQASCYTNESVMELKNKVCDALLEHRVEAKLKGNRTNAIFNRLHVAQPKARDDVVRRTAHP